MNIELFTLCDGAYNYNGKLTIVGTLDVMNADSVPATVQIGIAMKLRFAPEETGKHKLTIRIINPEGGSIPPDFSLDLDIRPSEKGSQVALAVNAQGLSLDKFGDYTTKVFMDDEEKGSYSFTLIKKLQWKQ